MSKTFLTVIAVLLGVVVVFWVAVSVYGAAFEVEVNPNAEQYIPKINPKFDTEIIDEVTERVKILPVSPKVFHELKYDDSDIDYGGTGDEDSADEGSNEDEESNDNSDE